MKISLSFKRHPIACMCSIEEIVKLLVEKFQLEYDQLVGEFLSPPE